MVAAKRAGKTKKSMNTAKRVTRSTLADYFKTRASLFDLIYGLHFTNFFYRNQT